MEKTITIHYLSSKKGIIDHLVSLYHEEGIVFEPFSSDLTLKTVQYLLLIEPFEDNSEYFAASKLWKNWLAQKAPYVHLIVATFAHSRHSNFINLADLPRSLKNQFASVVPVKEFVPEYSHTVKINNVKRHIMFDPWNIYLPLSGQDINKVMERFIRGHDKSYSYFEQLGRIRKDMDDLIYWKEKQKNQAKKSLELTQKIHHLYKNIQKELDYLLNRWNQYEGLMSFLPFQKSASIIKEQMDVLEALIDNEAWDNKKAQPNMNAIERIGKELRTNFLPHIYSEQI